VKKASLPRRKGLKLKWTQKGREGTPGEMEFPELDGCAEKTGILQKKEIKCFGMGSRVMT